MWLLGHVCHVTYNFINMLFISTVILMISSTHMTVSYVGRNTSNNACQLFSSKGNCETMHHWWFFLLEKTVVKIMTNLRKCRWKVVIMIVDISETRYVTNNVLDNLKFISIITVFDLNTNNKTQLSKICYHQDHGWYERHIYEVVCHMTNVT
jgi:hypothetical protein